MSMVLSCIKNHVLVYSSAVEAGFRHGTDTMLRVVNAGNTLKMGCAMSSDSVARKKDETWRIIIFVTFITNKQLSDDMKIVYMYL
ncbi:uncharacterized protein LOC123536562 isoform X2 [Mercenaria mercenaria]|uniref:uncharacterized protein LOC123536562 isoform X2 n=1 Tax=Mercenaria mercenaria TaxID=6596 RepID=UPI001E1DD52F|nr:uncharacterized protein LOC123536562 isoform X2 [Mercenaria mercenaria]